MDAKLERRMLMTGMVHGPPVSAETVRAVERQMRVRFPDDYVDFMGESNGAEGPIGSSEYLSLWRIEEVPSRNAANRVSEVAPGLVLFGSDGGGTAYAFAVDSSRGGKTRIVEVDFIGLAPEAAIDRGGSLLDLLRVLAAGR